MGRSSCINTTSDCYKSCGMGQGTVCLYQGKTWDAYWGCGVIEKEKDSHFCVNFGKGGEIAYGPIVMCEVLNVRRHIRAFLTVGRWGMELLI